MLAMLDMNVPIGAESLCQNVYNIEICDTPHCYISSYITNISYIYNIQMYMYICILYDMYIHVVYTLYMYIV